MTFKLNTLQDVTPTPTESTGWRRFLHEIALVVGFVALAFTLISLLSFHRTDPAWGLTTGYGMGTPAVANWGGRMGAWFALARHPT